MCVCVHFQPLISKTAALHSQYERSTPPLHYTQLNEVNKLKLLLPSPTLFHQPPSSLPPPLPSPPKPSSLFSSPLFLFFNCHCCTVKALGFPRSISQDRAAITAQERRRPAVRRRGKAAEEAKEESALLRQGMESHIPFQHLGPWAWTSQGHHDQTGIIRNNTPFYDLALLSALSEHK